MAAQELDHLFTKVSMQAKEFLGPAKEVVTATEAMEASVVRFQRNATAALEGVGAAVSSVQAAVSGTLAILRGDIHATAGALAGMVTSLPRSATNGLTSLLTTLSTLPAPNTRRINVVINNLKNLQTAVTNYANAGAVASSVGADLAPLFNALSGVSAVDGRAVRSVISAVEKLSEAIKNNPIAIPPDVPDGITALYRSLARMKPIPAATVNSVRDAIGKIGPELAKIPTGMSPDLGRNLGGLFRALKGLDPPDGRKVGSMVITIGKMAGISTEIATLGSAIGGLTRPSGRAINGIVDAVTKLSGGLDAYAQTKVSAKAIAADLTDFGNALAKLSGVGTQIAPLSKSFSQVGNLLLGASAYKPGTLQAATTEITAFAGSLNQMALTASPAHLAAMTTSIASVNALIRTAAKFDPAKLAALTGGLRAFMTGITAIPITSNAQKVAAVVQSLSNSLAGMGGKGGGPGLPAALGAVPPAANKATEAAVKTRASFDALRDSGVRLSTSLSGLRLSLLGVSVFGLFNFAQTDDALTRTIAHMKILGTYEESTYEGFRQAIRKLSGESITGNVELAKSLDILASSGLSAGAAIDTLPTAESFAVASGAKMEEATRKLIDVQNSLGLVSEKNIGEHIAYTRQVADMLVYAARASGSSEMQLADAITGRLVTAMDRTKMEAVEAIAIVSTLSKVSKSFRGSTGGDTAARGIAMLTEAAESNVTAWQQLGISAVDDTGKFRNFLDVLDEINKKMAGVDTPKALAQLGVSGIGSDLKTVNAIELMLKYAAAMKEMRDRLADAGGTSEMVANQIRGSLLSVMKNLWNNVVNVTGVFGYSLAPALTVVAGAAASALNAFTRMNAATAGLVVWSLVLYAGLRPLISLLTYGFMLAISPITALIGSTLWLVKGFWAFGVAVRAAWVMTTAWIATTYAAVAASRIMANVIWVSRFLYKGLELAIVGVYTAFRTGQIFVTAFYAAVVGLAVVLGAPITAFLGLIWVLGKTAMLLGHILSAAVQGLTYLWLNLGKIALSAVAGIFSLLLNAAAGIATIIVFLPILTAIVAAVVAVGVAVYQVIGLVGVGLVRAWDAVRDATRAAVEWSVSGLSNSAASVAAFWEAARKSTRQFLNDAQAGFEKLAGFFWNFRENYKVIFVFVRSHGSTMIGDLVDVAFNLIKTLAFNAGQLLMGIAAAAAIGISTAFTTILSYGGTVVTWIRGEWANLMSDMTTLTLTFFSNLAKNFGLLDTKFAELRNLAMREWVIKALTINGLDDAAGKAQLDKIAAQREAILGDLFTKLKGPLEGLDESKLKTGKSIGNPFGTGEMTRWEFVLKRDQILRERMWGQAGTDMADAFANRLAKTNPIYAAFAPIIKSPLWQEMFLKLNTTLPPDFAGELGKWFLQMVKPDLERDDNAGVPGGGQGPGYTFKQTSEARTLIGGEAAFNLQIQQLVTLKEIKGILADRLQAGGNLYENLQKGPLKWKEE